MAAFLSSCTATGTKGGQDAESDSLKIVATIFPEYDWVREILGEASPGASLTLLLDNGADMHSYQPSADDIIAISDCDIFIYVGGESDEWVKDALENAENKDMKVLCLLDILGGNAREEVLQEGMQEDEKPDISGFFGNVDGASPEQDEEPEYDEHVWLSLRNAKIFCSAICGTLCEADPENEVSYRENTAAYIKKLDALDGAYKETVSCGKTRTLLFADRFPFLYLTDDYGLGYYAAFPGCSAESEASFETIIFLSEKADELGLSSVLILEGSERKLADTIISCTASGGQEVLTLDSMQYVTASRLKKGISYLEIMEENRGVLKKALS